MICCQILSSLSTATFSNAYSRSLLLLLVQRQFPWKIHPFKTSLSFSTTVTENPHPKTSVINDYLINSWGFSKDEALPASIHCKHINSTEKPKSVIEFLKQTGFNETHIRNLLSRQPRYLLCNIDKTLKPKFEFFQGLGLSGSALADLAVTSPGILWRNLDNQIKPLVDFLRTVLRNDEDVVKALKNGYLFLYSSLRTILMPNVEVLRRSGISDSHISWLILKQPSIFRRRPDFLEKVITRVKDTGIECGSNKFLRGITTFALLGEAELKAKLNVFKSFGWSEEDILCAFRKSPYTLALKESNIRVTMGFLLNEVGYQPVEIACRPNLLNYSLEKRLIPRNEVLKTLKSRGLLKRKMAFSSIAVIPEKRFLNDYVLRYIDDAPDIQQVYMACSDDEVRQMKNGYRETFVSL